MLSLRVRPSTSTSTSSMTSASAVTTTLCVAPYSMVASMPELTDTPVKSVTSKVLEVCAEVAEARATARRRNKDFMVGGFREVCVRSSKLAHATSRSS